MKPVEVGGSSPSTLSTFSLDDRGRVLLHLPVMRHPLEEQLSPYAKKFKSSLDLEFLGGGEHKLLLITSPEYREKALLLQSWENAQRSFAEALKTCTAEVKAMWEVTVVKPPPDVEEAILLQDVCLRFNTFHAMTCQYLKEANIKESRTCSNYVGFYAYHDAKCHKACAHCFEGYVPPLSPLQLFLKDDVRQSFGPDFKTKDRVTQAAEAKSGEPVHVMTSSGGAHIIENVTVQAIQEGSMHLHDLMFFFQGKKLPLSAHAPFQKMIKQDEKARASAREERDKQAALRRMEQRAKVLNFAKLIKETKS